MTGRTATAPMNDAELEREPVWAVPTDLAGSGLDDLPDRLDFLVMEARDRMTNLGFFAGGGIVWILVALVLTTRDPRSDPAAGSIGALLIGLAIGLTVVPLFWLATFARHRRIAYRGDWSRAVRRGGWVAVVTAVFVILRLQGAFAPALALFILALVVLAESVLSVER